MESLINIIDRDEDFSYRSLPEKEKNTDSPTPNKEVTTSLNQAPISLPSLTTSTPTEGKNMVENFLRDKIFNEEKGKIHNLFKAKLAETNQKKK